MVDLGSYAHQYSLNDKPNQDWVFEYIDCSKTNTDGNNNSNDKCWSEAYGYPCYKTCRPIYFIDNHNVMLLAMMPKDSHVVEILVMSILSMMIVNRVSKTNDV